ncbi:MAG: ubiquinol-cytochrome C chaperone family protein [Pseudolabrys sp.]
MALAAGDDAGLEQAIARNVYGGSPPNPAAVVQLAAYMKQANRDLVVLSTQSLAAGAYKFPEPASIPATA